jgi:hypothetical protein
MLPKGYRNPASPGASQLFWLIIVSRLTFVVTGLIGFMLPPLVAGHLAAALRDAKGYIIAIAVVWFGLGLVNVAFWSQLFGQVGAPTWVMSETAQGGKRRYLLTHGFLGLALGLCLGASYVHARTR